MKSFATIVRGFKIWMPDMVELVNHPVFISFQYFVVVQVVFNIINKEIILALVQNLLMCFIANITMR